MEAVNDFVYVQKNLFHKASKKGGGVSVPQFCPQCGKQNSDTARFCDSCGNSLSTGAPPAPKKEVIIIERDSGDSVIKAIHGSKSFVASPLSPLFFIGWAFILSALLQTSYSSQMRTTQSGSRDILLKGTAAS